MGIEIVDRLRLRTGIEAEDGTESEIEKWIEFNDGEQNRDRGEKLESGRVGNTV
jgi:hypothetical protein